MFSRTHLICSSLVIGLLASSCASSARAPMEPSPQRAHVKVMTYNVNYGIAGDRSTIDAIAREDADVVLLQETTAQWERHLRAELSEQYPHMAFEHCCGAGGLAVLSKAPFRTLDYMEAPEPGWFPAWRIEAQTDIGKVQMLNVHLRPPVSDSGSFVSGYFSSGSVHAIEMAAYRQKLDADIPTIIMGDFNESSGESLRALAEDNMVSVLPEFAPEQTTWRWQTSLGQVTHRLDHIVYSNEALTALNAYVLEEGRSDHLPVVALFEVR